MKLIVIFGAFILLASIVPKMFRIPDLPQQTEGNKALCSGIIVVLFFIAIIVYIVS